MTQGTLLPNHAEVKLLCLRPKDGAIQMEVQGCRVRVTCPVCGTASSRVHSRYARRLGERASWGRASLVTFLSIAFISLGLACSTQASAQDSGNASAPQQANPPASAESSDASQSAPPQDKDVQSQPESGWYDSALSAKLSGMSLKSWGTRASLPHRNKETT
jgi:hypothetical protein